MTVNRGAALSSILSCRFLFSASKERLGGGRSGGGGIYMGGWLKYNSSKLGKDALCGVSTC